MWEWLALALVGIVVFWAVQVVRSPHTKDRSQPDLQRIIRDLLIRLENGAFCRIDFRERDIWFSLERLGHDEDAANLVLRIPDRKWSRSSLSELRETFGRHGFEFRLADENPNMLAKVEMHVKDIWQPDSGARGAHAVRLLLGVIGISATARFDFEEGGWPSDRARRNVNRGGKDRHDAMSE